MSPEKRNGKPLLSITAPFELTQDTLLNSRMTQPSSRSGNGKNELQKAYAGEQSVSQCKRASSFKPSLLEFIKGRIRRFTFEAREQFFLKKSACRSFLLLLNFDSTKLNIKKKKKSYSPFWAH